MKHLVFVIESLDLGGAEKSLVTLLQNIDYKAYTVDLILFKKGGIFEQLVPREVIIIYNNSLQLNIVERIQYKLRKEFNSNGLHHAQLLWQIIQSNFKRENKEYDIAFAYSQGFTTYFVDQCIKASKKFAWLNTDYQKTGYEIEFDYPIYKNYDAVVAVSPEAKLTLENELNRIQQILSIKIIKDISDKIVIKQKSNEPLPIVFKTDTVNIVTVGRLSKDKGLHLAVESCEKLIDKGHSVHWYIVGEGTERDTLEELIKKKKLTKHVTLVGMTDNPYPYMKACSIYVQTSLFEGLGLTVIEAASLNKPIVCTNFPTVYGTLKDGETGLIAEMNSQSLTDKIELLINDSDLTNRLVTNLSQLENADKERTLLEFESLIH
ncbi:glycosyltransferase [Flavobacterium caseinilyticum]|uniref:Glycosyltransferase n=1 Tax=Flavobacterium caseinilyticum TaxID=2541732 RepID=A0A4R5AZ43_9FLAO|nr:glycosyltransferase [Flavobacterium caseinilyticum]TDD75932.1 glycosyltransferase [Flavobacterium caseinilyticum]